jgi:hypothetical protein
MLTYAVIAFAIAAVGGLVLASSVLRGRLASWSISLIHALVGATGLVITLIALINGAGSKVQTAFIVLVIAALGGFYLASIHLGKKIAPKVVVIIHALVAVIGFVLLAGSVFAVL